RQRHGSVGAGLFEPGEVLHVRGVRRPRRELLETEQPGQRRYDRGMLVAAMVDQVPGNERRDDDGGDARTQPIEGEAVFPAYAAGRASRRRSHVIIETAMLVIGDDEHAALPDR